jgi:hypothetical protein
MDMRIYTSSGHRSIILYVQCGSVFPLLNFEGSSMELITGEDTS